MTEGPGFVTLIRDQPGLRLPGDKSMYSQVSSAQ